MVTYIHRNFRRLLLPAGAHVRARGMAPVVMLLVLFVMLPRLSLGQMAELPKGMRYNGVANGQPISIGGDLRVTIVPPLSWLIHSAADRRTFMFKRPYQEASADGAEFTVSLKSISSNVERTPKIVVLEQIKAIKKSLSDNPRVADVDVQNGFHQVRIASGETFQLISSHYEKDGITMKQVDAIGFSNRIKVLLTFAAPLNKAFDYSWPTIEKTLISMRLPGTHLVSRYGGLETALVLPVLIGLMVLFILYLLYWWWSRSKPSRRRYFRHVEERQAAADNYAGDDPFTIDQWTGEEPQILIRRDGDKASAKADLGGVAPHADREKAAAYHQKRQEAEKASPSKSGQRRTESTDIKLPPLPVAPEPEPKDDKAMATTSTDQPTKDVEAADVVAASKPIERRPLPKDLLLQKAQQVAEKQAAAAQAKIDKATPKLEKERKPGFFARLFSRKTTAKAAKATAANATKEAPAMTDNSLIGPVLPAAALAAAHAGKAALKEDDKIEVDSSLDRPLPTPINPTLLLTDSQDQARGLIAPQDKISDDASLDVAIPSKEPEMDQPNGKPIKPAVTVLTDEMAEAAKLDIEPAPKDPPTVESEFVAEVEAQQEEAEEEAQADSQERTIEGATAIDQGQEDETEAEAEPEPESEDKAADDSAAYLTLSPSERTELTLLLDQMKGSFSRIDAILAKAEAKSQQQEQRIKDAAKNSDAN